MSSKMEASPKGPKTMSSRLMTMKFMQRAAASSATPQSSGLAEPSTKRQKLTPGSSSAQAPEYQVFQAALAAEEAKREEAIARQAAEAGETRWVLSFRDQDNNALGGRGYNGIHVINTSYAGLDQTTKTFYDDEESSPGPVGRRSFGKFKRESEKRQESPEDVSSDEESESSDPGVEEDDDEDDPTGAAALIRQSRVEASQRARAERRAKRIPEKADLLQLASERRSKEVKLNELTSISGVGDDSRMECHRCHRKGHKARNCPGAGPSPRGNERRKGEGSAPRAKHRV